jgi:glutathione peroxidase
MKNLLILTLSILSSSVFACSDLLNSNLRVLDSDDELNFASRCGYTPQYAALQRIYSKYKDDGFVVIGIPSRDFKQEFSEEAKVAEFCSTEYGVDFPMFATAKVKGENAHPFYKKLIAASGKEPRWNFAKYLIGRDGEVIDHYKSRVTPESEKLVSAITAVL